MRGFNPSGNGGALISRQETFLKLLAGTDPTAELEDQCELGLIVLHEAERELDRVRRDIEKTHGRLCVECGEDGKWRLASDDEGKAKLLPIFTRKTD